MKRGFLLIDQNKCVCLFTFEDIESYKTFGELAVEKTRNGEVKEHNTRADLNKTISEFLKGKLEIGGNDDGS